MKRIFLLLISFLILFFGFSYLSNGAETKIKVTCSGDSILNNGKLCSTNFMIDTTNLGLAGNKIKAATSKATLENGLTTIVQKLLIAFGVLSLFIMTIGGGYMIFAAGQDELLNKGKSIFNSGLIALLVALGSGMIMKIIIYLLY